MNLGQALGRAAERLSASGVDSAQYDARAIAAHLMGVNHLLIDRQAPVPAEFDAFIARRMNREPLQHILGTAPFGHLDLAVGPGVFIPRPETEVLADWAVRRLRALPVPRPKVVDLCTGSGALAQYIASLVPDAVVIGVEKQAVALDYARRNAPLATVIEGDVCAPILSEHYGTVDLVVTNPPYVPRSNELAPEVYADPDEAVFGGADGMEIISAMMPLISHLLVDGGLVGLEHDDTTSQKVQDCFRAHGLTDIEVLNDLTGRARFVTASKLDPQRYKHEGTRENQ